MNIQTEGTLLLVLGIAGGALGWVLILTDTHPPLWSQYAITALLIAWVLWFVTWASRGGMPYAGGMR